ncbi:delta(3,5)-Delta(2,4)-dienoyl-CoA isomerase, mitochondrial-like [Dugong dugon]
MASMPSLNMAAVRAGSIGVCPFLSSPQCSNGAGGGGFSQTLGPADPAEMVEFFNKISEDASCGTVLVSGGFGVPNLLSPGSDRWLGQWAGPGRLGEPPPTSPPGIDLTDIASGLLQPPGDDVARKSWYLGNIITRYQETFSVIEKCPKPVITAIHGGCIGAGVDLITACDIRYCAQDAFFQVKVDMGVASDVGTLQRLPRVIGGQSLVNELAFTARKLMADEALSSGLVSRVFPDKEALFDAAFSLAAEISSKSPVAVQGTKVNLLYARDHPVADSLDFVRNWNMSMLQTDDIMESVQAAMEKKELKSVTFSRL